MNQQGGHSVNSNTQVPKSSRTSSNSNSNSSINLSPPDSRRNSLIESEDESGKSTPNFDDSISNNSDGSKYNIEDYHKVIKKLWRCDGKQLKPHLNFRTLVDFSLTRSLTLTNSQRRSIKISDLSIFPLRQRSPTQAVALVVRSSSVGDTPYSFYGCLRAKNVDVCPHAALAIYLFSRLHFPDSYGTTEIPMDLAKKNQQAIKTFNETRLLKGNNKLQSISYTQQHKSVVKALEIAGVENFNQINIGKFSSVQQLKLDPTQKPASATINDLPEDVLYKLAGFENIHSYKIKRDMVEPPKELLDQIFPFINDDNFDIFDIFTIRIKNVLGMLRRSLTQDMVILRKEYPEDPICQHPIFNSELFNKFANELEQKGGATNQLSPTPSPKFFNPLPDPRYASKNHRNVNHDLTNLINLQLQNESKINYLQQQIDFFIRNQASIYNDLHAFIHHQNDIYNKQAEYLKSNPSVFGNLTNSAMKESLSGTLELISRLNSSQQNFFSIVNNANFFNTDVQPLLKQFDSAPGMVLTPLPQHGHIQHGPPQHGPPQQGPPQHGQPQVKKQSLSEEQVSFLPDQQVPNQQVPNQPVPNQQVPLPMGPPPPHMIPMGLPHPQFYPHAMPPHMGPMGPVPMGVPPGFPLMPESDLAMKRNQALHRRLSRQAINVYEMWDDFKSLHHELEENEVSVTEWLKLHGSSERQFRHTRQKIVRFIEEEAQRTNSPVELVKDRLHSKMRNRPKPWTLDEVQRMLTSGKRIKLD